MNLSNYFFTTDSLVLSFLVPAHPGSPRQSPGGRKIVVVVAAVEQQ